MNFLVFLLFLVLALAAPFAVGKLYLFMTNGGERVGQLMGAITAVPACLTLAIIALFDSYIPVRLQLVLPVYALVGGVFILGSLSVFFVAIVEKTEFLISSTEVFTDKIMFRRDGYKGLVRIPARAQVQVEISLNDTQYSALYDFRVTDSARLLELRKVLSRRVPMDSIAAIVREYLEQHLTSNPVDFEAEIPFEAYGFTVHRKKVSSVLYS